MLFPITKFLIQLNFCTKLITRILSARFLFLSHSSFFFFVFFLNSEYLYQSNRNENQYGENNVSFFLIGRFLSYFFLHSLREKKKAHRTSHTQSRFTKYDQLKNSLVRGFLSFIPNGLACPHTCKATTTIFRRFTQAQTHWSHSWNARYWWKINGIYLLVV